MSAPLLELQDVHAGYGPIEVLKGISCTVHAGEIVTVIGANGAGKTSTLMAISGLLPLRKGRIIYDRHDLSAMRADQIVGLGLCHVPEGRKIFGRMTVQENLSLGSWLVMDGRQIVRNRDRVFALFPILADRRNQTAGTLSGGEQQMLAIGRALMGSPRLLLLDEPSMGVAPILTQRIFETLAALNREGMSMLLIEQNAHLALKVARRGYVFETGRIVTEGDSAALMNDARVREAYLGEA